MCAKLLQSFQTLSDPHRLQPTRLLCPWDSPGKNTGVGCHALPQRTLPTQGLDPCLLRLWRRQAGSFPLAPPGKPYWLVIETLPRKAMRCLPGAGELSVYGQAVSCFCGEEQGTTNMPLQRRGLVSRQGSPWSVQTGNLFTELRPLRLPLGPS